MLKAIASTPWPKLILIAGTMGTFTAGMGLMAHRQREKVLGGTPFLKESLEMIKIKEITDILGTDDPKIGRPSLSNPWSKIDAHKIKLVVPIKGKTDKASLYIVAERKETTEKYKVTSLTMEFKSIKGKKLVVLDQPLNINL